MLAIKLAENEVKNLCFKDPAITKLRLNLGTSVFAMVGALKPAKVVNVTRLIFAVNP